MNASQSRRTRLVKDQPDDRLHPIESKYMAGAAVVEFLLTLLLTCVIGPEEAMGRAAEGLASSSLDRTDG
jgi:hypothetical protein